MFQFCISDEIHAACPAYVAAVIEAGVTAVPTPAALLDEMAAETAALRRRLTTDGVKALSAVAATRAAYRRCGKDPGRYRPSGEQLMRRVVQGKDLYVVDALVDLLNLASLRSGYSIGGFDADRIVGSVLSLGIGREGEPYEGIGRGPLNIAGMPVWRDAAGGVGTPTSDNVRTRLTASTCRLLTIVNGYDGCEEALHRTADDIRAMLRRYGSSDGGTLRFIRHGNCP